MPVTDPLQASFQYVSARALLDFMRLKFSMDFSLRTIRLRIYTIAL